MFFRLLALFITIPVIELYLFLKIGSRIGWGTTLLVIVATGVLGAWLTKRQGLRALDRFRAAATEGRLPHAEVVDGIMILIAGAVLLTPGFLTDAAGFLLLTPAVRDWIRPALARGLEKRVRVVTTSSFPGAAPGADAPMRQVEGKVFDVDVDADVKPSETREKEPDAESR